MLLQSGTCESSRQPPILRIPSRRPARCRPKSWPPGRQSSEHLARYVSRAPVATERLSLTESGHARYALKTPYRDGTTQVIFEPGDFIAHLAALVPKPRAHLTRSWRVRAGEPRPGSDRAQDPRRLPVCVARTPLSFTADPAVAGAPEGFQLKVRRVLLSAGAGFLVPLVGDVPRMPGLPADPQTRRMDLEDGRVTGLV